MCWWLAFGVRLRMVVVVLAGNPVGGGLLAGGQVHQQ